MAIHHCTAQAGWQGLADLLGKAAAGDEIHLEAGTYHGTAPLSLPSGMRLIGIEGVILRQDGEGPILAITGSDCQLSKIGFRSTRKGQICVEITDAERVLVSKCVCDGGGVSSAAIFVERSQQVTIRSCTAKGFYSGIVLEYSQAEVVGNRCHNNTHVGILFLSSTGRAEDNDCWGNQNQPVGIAVQCHPKSPERQSNVTVIGNRCYNNTLSGIIFSSSIGWTKANDCWGQKHGIVVRNFSQVPGQPSDVTVVGNRCHDNTEAGIQFFESTGRAKDNDCWRNKSLKLPSLTNLGHGIIIQCNPKAPGQSSDVTVIGNRCYDNTRAGILFFGSTGQAKDNDCWGQRRGIAIRFAPNAPHCPSNVTLVGNRCHDNTQTGILFSRSTGRAEANECWGNQDNEISSEDESEVIIHDHRTFPSQSPEELRKLRLLLHPLGAWLTNPLVINHPSAEGLADFLHSGGCPHCFTRFWAVGTQATPTPPPTETPTAVPTDDRIRTYEVRPSQNQSVTIHRTTVPPGRATVSRNGLEGLTSLLSRFSDLVKNRTPQDLPLRWAVGFISAEPANKTTFHDWLKIAKTHDPNVEGRFVDCALSGPDSAADPLSKLEQTLVAPYRTWRHRLGARVEALLCMPAREVLIAGITMLILTISSVIVLARTFDIDMPLWPLPENSSTLTKTLIYLSTNILDQWQNHLSTMGMIAGAWILVPLFLWNRNLPRSLHISLTFLMATFKAIAEIGLIKEVLQATPLKRLGEFVQLHACSQTSRGFWLRRQLYGYRLFDRIRPGAPSPRLITLLHVDVPTQADLEDMRLLLEICPNNQPVLVLTQMSGLSMLTSAYLDVWFPRTATGNTRPPTAYLLHDLDAGMIQPIPDPRFIPTKNDEERILEDFDHLLGWSDREHSPDQRRETLIKNVNMLTLPEWAFKEFILALVIGSTPYTHMMVSRPYTEQYGPNFLNALKPYLSVLTLDTPTQPDLTTSELCIERGAALLPVKVDRNTQLQWVGRGGYRRALADLVRQWYAYRAKTAESEPYLARLLMCEELYNLIRLTTLVSAQQSSDDRHQLLPLHMEAACALVEERLAVSSETAEPSVLVDQWQSVITQVLRRDSGPILTESVRARLCAMYLKATARYRCQGRNTLGRQEEQELNDVIAQPFHEIEGTTLWAAFCRDVATLLQQLAYRETATASALLEAKLAQEWHAFPDALKEMLRNQCANFSRDWIEDIDRQNSLEMLLERAQRLREQPALVVGTLSRLAVASLGTSSSESDRTSLLIRIADAVLRLRRAAGDDAPSVQLEPWKQFPTSEAISAATTLLCDEAIVQRLCTILGDGAKSRDKLRRAVEHVVCPIEGIALGVHGHLHKVLELAKEADEVAVMGSAEMPNQHQVVV